MQISHFFLIVETNILKQSSISLSSKSLFWIESMTETFLNYVKFIHNEKKSYRERQCCEICFQSAANV